MVAYEDVRFPDVSDAWADDVCRPTVVQRMDLKIGTGECITTGGAMLGGDCASVDGHRPSGPSRERRFSGCRERRKRAT